MNISSVLDQHARSRGAATAVVYDDVSMTYAELARMTSRFAAMLLKKGVRPGDRIGILLPNVIEFVVGFLGCLRVGVVPLTLNVRLRAEDNAALLHEVEAHVVLATADTAASLGAFDLILSDGLIDELGNDDYSEVIRSRPTQSYDMSNIVFTSGSTARPKGVMQTHGMHLSTGAALAGLLKLSADDATILISPLFHIAGLTMLFTALHLGGPFVLCESSKPDLVLEKMERNQVSYVHMVGTVLVDIINNEQASPSHRKLPFLKYVLSGGATIAEQRLRWLEDHFDCRALSAYGRTEGGKTWSDPDSDQRWTSNGLVNRDVCEVRIVDPETGHSVPSATIGEIRVRGDGISLGYWRRPELNAELFDSEGWMKTGDSGFIDSADNLHFVGRADGMIKTGGENVAPQDVERALVQIDGVVEVVVVAVPHERLGQTVGALVVCNSETTPQAIQDASRQLLAGFKIPRTIRIVTELPKLGSTKVDMAAVVQALCDEQAPDRISADDGPR